MHGQGPLRHTALVDNYRLQVRGHIVEYISSAKMLPFCEGKKEKEALSLMKCIRRCRMGRRSFWSWFHANTRKVSLCRLSVYICHDQVLCQKGFNLASKFVHHLMIIILINSSILAVS